MNKQQRHMKKLKKAKARKKAFNERKAVLKIMREHNKVKYRAIPGMPGMYPYQLSPITYAEALHKLKTGSLPVRKEVKNKMTDAQKQRLAELQALETLAEEEKPVLEALLKVEAAQKALDDAKAVQPVDPVAVAQTALDEATAAYEQAEATFKATQGGTTSPSGDASQPSDAGATPSDAQPAEGASQPAGEATPADATPSDTTSGEQPQA